MKKLLFIFMCGVFLLSLYAEDADVVVLEKRSLRDIPGSSKNTPVPGIMLWYYQGYDNVNAIRSIPDVNNDGIDDVVVSIYDAGYPSGEPNLFCFDGNVPVQGDPAVVLWTGDTSGGPSDSGGYGEKCVAIIGDVNMDNICDVLYGTAWGGRTAYCYDGSDGDILWLYDTYVNPPDGWVLSVDASGDLNGDGIPDGVFSFGSDANRAYAFDGAAAGTGSIIWQNLGSDAIQSVLAYVDLTGDGVPEVVTGGGDYNHVVRCLNGATGTVHWAYDTGATNWTLEQIDDIDGDGLADVLLGLWASSNSIRCISSQSQGAASVIWQSSAVSTYIMDLAVMNDVNDDGKQDFIVGSWDNAVYCLSGADGGLIWETPTGSLNGGDVWTVDVIDSVDLDNKQDVIAGSFDNLAYCLDGTDGYVWWTYDVGARILSCAGIGDVDGDGLPDVAIGTQETQPNASETSYVYALSGGAHFLTSPNLALGPSDIVMDPAGGAQPGDLVSIDVTYHNVGVSDAESMQLVVQYFYDDQWHNIATIADSLPAGDSHTQHIDWQTEPTIDTPVSIEFYVECFDPREMDVGNNVWTIDYALPVELASFQARYGDGRVMLTWTTISEVDNLGFNLYRLSSKQHKRLKVNDGLIPGAGTSSEPHNYFYLDARAIAPGRHAYILETVSVTGVREDVGRTDLVVGLQPGQR